MAGDVYRLPRELVLLGLRAYHRGDLGVRPSALMGRGAACEDEGDGAAEDLELLRSMTVLGALTEGGSWKSLASRSLDSSSVGSQAGDGVEGSVLAKALWLPLDSEMEEKVDCELLRFLV